MNTTNSNQLLVVGDVHGQIDKLEEAIAPYLGSGREIIFLGDLIDRASEPDGDIRVLQYVKDLQDNSAAYGLAGVTVLLGNHERYLLNLKTKYNDDKYRLWEHNGGSPELFAVVDPYLPWIDSFEYYNRKLEDENRRLAEEESDLDDRLAALGIIVQVSTPF